MTPFFVGLALIAALVVYRHWNNIDRLRNGTEDKLDFGFMKSGNGDEESSSSEEPEQPSEPEKDKEE